MLVEIWQLVLLILMLKSSVVCVMVGKMKVFYYYVIFVMLLLIHIVPKGDWFCHDCTISRSTNDNNEMDDRYDIPTAESSLTIFDIVREPNSQVLRRLRPSPAILISDRVNRNKDKPPNSGARTLHRCRHVQRSIQALHENWNALRSGSLRFYSSSLESGGTYGRKQDSDSLSHGKSNQPHSLASTNLQQSTIQGSPSSNTVGERGLKDVHKAWKMMERAKMMQNTHQRTNILPPGLDHPSSGAGARKASSVCCNFKELKTQQSRKSIRMGQQFNSSFNKDLDSHRLPKLGEQKHIRVTCKELTQLIKDHASPLEGYCEPSLSEKVHTSIQGAPCHENGERNFAKEQSRSSCLVTSVYSAPSHSKFDSVSSSSREVDEKKRLAKSFGDRSTRKSEYAKNEIKSLVKLNLKVLR